MITPDNFDWIKDGGLSRKALGHFTEDDVTIEMVQWDGTGGPAHRFQPDRTSLAFVLKGAVTAAGQSVRYPDRDLVGLRREPRTQRRTPAPRRS